MRRDDVPSLGDARGLTSSPQPADNTMDEPNLRSGAEAGVSRVLVIDDDPDLGRVVRRVLELEGYDVVLSDDGLRGLAAAQRQRPDVIVLDLMMPVMDGYQVLAELRGDPRTKDIPVVVLSAVALDETRERVEAAGASMFLTKPFEPSHLSRALMSLIGGSAD
jgi:chemosensory pili system protein ChpA (sensor histidine kinase/response regulator)